MKRKCYEVTILVLTELPLPAQNIQLQNSNIWAGYEVVTASSSGTPCPPPGAHRSAPSYNTWAEPEEDPASASNVTLDRGSCASSLTLGRSPVTAPCAPATLASVPRGGVRDSELH